MPANVLSFDVECWFHAHNLRGAIRPEHWQELPHRLGTPLGRILATLRRHDVKATFFVLGWVAERLNVVPSVRGMLSETMNDYPTAADHYTEAGESLARTYETRMSSPTCSPARRGVPQ